MISLPFPNNLVLVQLIHPLVQPLVHHLVVLVLDNVDNLERRGEFIDDMLADVVSGDGGLVVIIIGIVGTGISNIAHILVLRTRTSRTWRLLLKRPWSMQTNIMQRYLQINQVP